ncbi:hypothetical protein EV702DRAFT_1202083 [Suillus placidus]|uniref:Uncharacterized protein n=1 Tax=Suillus placidus TaxID=48579 RepID=A0A9P7CYA5_9AGAM|nr:hypothetical protein EV702DRAFT_1202083 [Suillus placidus]
MTHAASPQISTSSSSGETATVQQGSQEYLVSASSSLQDLTNQLTGRMSSAIAYGGFGDIWRCYLLIPNGTVQVAVKAIRAFESDDDVAIRQKMPPSVPVTPVASHADVLVDQEGYAYSAYLVEAGQMKVFAIRPDGVIGAIVHGPILLIHTNQLDVCKGHYVDVTAEIWDDVIDLLTVVNVTRRAEMTLPDPLPLDAQAISLPDNQSAPPSQINRQDRSDDEKITIKVVFESGEIYTAKISRETRVDKLVADRLGILYWDNIVPLISQQFGVGQRCLRTGESDRTTSRMVTPSNFVCLGVLKSQSFIYTRPPISMFLSSSPSELDGVREIDAYD